VGGARRRESGFDKRLIQPAAAMDGIAIGCAYYGWLEILKQRAHSSWITPMSATLHDKDIASATQKFLFAFKPLAVPAAVTSVGRRRGCLPTSA